MTDTKGFDLVNWFDYCKADVTLVTFSPELLESLPSYGKIPISYEGYPYNPTYSEAQLMIESIGEGVYHVCIRDYSCGWTRDLGDGTYDYDYDEHPGWNDVERILDDLQKRIASGEIDLDKALMEYYTVGDDSLRLKPICIRKNKNAPSPRIDNRDKVSMQLKRLENKAFARRCMELMRDGGISDSDVSNLTDKGFCELAFGNSLPVLKRTFASTCTVPRNEVLVDGDQKYYYDVFRINGKRYIVTNDWYGFKPGAKRNNRVPFMDWMLDRIAC